MRVCVCGCTCVRACVGVHMCGCVCGCTCVCVHASVCACGVVCARICETYIHAIISGVHVCTCVCSRWRANTIDLYRCWNMGSYYVYIARGSCAVNHDGQYEKMSEITNHANLHWPPPSWLIFVRLTF